MAGILQTDTISHRNTAESHLHYAFWSTLRYTPAPAVCTRTLAEGVHRVDL